MAIISDGTTIADAGAFSASLGSMVLIKTVTASSSSTISFVDGASSVVLDSTYPIYVFKFINIHPASNGEYFEFNMSVDTGSNYNVTKTSTSFQAYHSEDDSSTSLAYMAGQDKAQSTAFHHISYNQSNANDASASGELFLYNPSSTTFVKHFICRNSTDTDDYSVDSHHAGYGNTTSAIDAVQFKMTSGNIDAGTIKLYGIKDS